MARQLEGRVAVITGAGTGIGRATALAMAREGARIAIGDVAIEAAEQTVRAITAGGGHAVFEKTNVTRTEEVEALIARAVQAFGRLDLAFNNAGIEGVASPVADYPEEVWTQVIAINLVGVFRCMQHEIRQMLAQGGGGAIVNNASILGTVGFAGASAYVSAKHGVLGLTKTAALEYALQGIRVNAVCPAFIETPMLERAGLTTNREARTMLENLHPVKRLGRPEEVAEAVVWLCSPAASFVTGHPLLVDGGYIAQ